MAPVEHGSAPELGMEGVSVDRDKLATLASGDPGGSPWAIEGKIDWQRSRMLRLISAALEDGTLVAVAAVRPAGAEDHGSDAVAGVVGDAEGDLSPLEESLISTEFGPDERPRRIGLELYRDAESAPLRIAGEVAAVGSNRETANGWTREAMRLELRSGGHGGHGLYEVLTKP